MTTITNRYRPEDAFRRDLNGLCALLEVQVVEGEGVLVDILREAPEQLADPVGVILIHSAMKTLNSAPTERTLAWVPNNSVSS